MRREVDIKLKSGATRFLSSGITHAINRSQSNAVLFGVVFLLDLKR
jgi:hypothetical protein